MRDAFAKELLALAGQNKDLVLLSGDIGNRMFDSFKKAHGERFFNCGVAEANMITVAAGMAMSGLRPIAYTIVPFITSRCLEQVRVDVCYHRQPVIIVGVGGGLAYANLGATHHACEDVAAMRSLPRMQVICPADAAETRAALRAAVAQRDPVYIRIGKKGEPAVHAELEGALPFRIGQAIRLTSTPNKASVTLLANGTIAAAALQAAETLRSEGVATNVYSFPTVKPLDEACLQRVFEESDLVCSVEEHNPPGGFGSAVAEWYVDQLERPQSPLLRIAAADAFFHETGDAAFARRQLGLDAAGIADRVRARLRTAKGNEL